MAKRKKQAKKTVGGPYLAAAFFCENVLIGNDGVVSAIRIIDKITITAPSDTPLQAAIPIALSGLLGFKSGDSPGKYALRLVVVSPSGKKTTALDQGLELGREPSGGANIHLKAGLLINESGVHWMDVYIDDKLVSRMPLQVIIQKPGANPQATAKESPAKKKG